LDCLPVDSQHGNRQIFERFGLRRRGLTAVTAQGHSGSGERARSVLVTGGNRGIGLAAGRALAESGHRVALTYRHDRPPAGFLAVQCDVTDDEALERAMSEVTSAQGAPEIVVANAGVSHSSVVTATDRDTWDTVLGTNVTAAFRLAQASVSGMLAAHWGRIILISSIVGSAGLAGQTAYTASKAAMVGLARSLAWELGPHGITVNTVAPGFIETRLAVDVSAKIRARFISMAPLRRSGTPEEVAAAVCFLASEQAAFITGATLPVSGGYGMGL
jgi:3-oxoacyl-[acyl-carrier protein] reductase